MMAFCAMSQILTKTKVIDGCINVILALLGRVPGGVGYASVIASAFMGALSGSGPGNVMATGSITIPSMIKSGFPAELAANIESVLAESLLTDEFADKFNKLVKRNVARICDLRE